MYFFRIMAIMSVPPPEAPTLKRMALLTAGSTTAKISSSTGCVVSGPSMGAAHSRKLSPTEVRRET